MKTATELLDFLTNQVTAFPSALEVDTYHTVYDGEKFYRHLEEYLLEKAEKEKADTFEAFSIAFSKGYIYRLEHKGTSPIYFEKSSNFIKTLRNVLKHEKAEISSGGASLDIRVGVQKGFGEDKLNE